MGKYQWKPEGRLPRRNCILAAATAELALAPADWGKPRGAVSSSSSSSSFWILIPRAEPGHARSSLCTRLHDRFTRQLHTRKTCVNGGRGSVVTTQVHFSLAQDPLKILQRPRRDEKEGVRHPCWG